MSFNFNDAVALGLEELYRRKEELESQENIDAGVYNVITNAISHLESEQEQKQAAEARKQEVEEQKTGYQLPKDYNVLFDDQRANDEILNLVQQTIDQVSAFYENQLAAKDGENLAAIQKLHTAYEDDLAQVRAQNKQLQDENLAVNDTCIRLREDIEIYKQKYELEQNDHAKVLTLLNETKGQLNDANHRATDAEQKRDAAVREVESLKAQIIELEQMTVKPKKAAFSLNLSSAIEDKPISNSRTAALKRAEELYGITPPVIGGEQPNGESFRGEDTDSSEPTSDVQQEGATGANEGLSGEDVKTFPLSDVDTALAGVSQETSGTYREAVAFNAEEEIEKLKKRIDRLEERANINKEVA